MSVFVLRRNSCLFFLFLCSIVCNAQTNITGVVIDQNSNPVPEASIQVVELKKKGVVSDFEGRFTLEVPSGSYTLKISYVGFKTYLQKVDVVSSETTSLTIRLQEDINKLSDVIVKGRTKAQKTREKAFEVEVIETKGLKNMSVDVNSVLMTIPGVNIRQNGGLGSGFDFSLNGLSGKQVKFFIDGIPQENFGSSLSLNNFPATLVERAEVFKGVVPIYLGADALGGAINIITNQRKNDFLDVSYDIGSFNTHRATLNGQYYSDKGFVAKVSSFYNYSDNDYKIDGIEIRDELGNDTGAIRNGVRRFHDAYNSQMITVKAGVVDKKIADQLLVGVTASANRNEIQHPIDPQNPFGEVFEENNVIQASITYEKRNLLKEKLNLKLFAAISENNDKKVDTSSRKYDWFGGFIERSDQDKGEFEFSKTLFEFKDKMHLLNASANYKIGEQSTLNFNYTKNYLKRQGEDPARAGRIAFNDPHILDKNILGLSYDVSLFEDSWNTTLFTKAYLLNSEGIIEDVYANDEDRYTKFKNNFEELGYGVASTYKMSDRIQIKGSFERTFRIPEGYEAFGDGLLLKTNPNLLPEESYNVNIGFLLNKQWDKLRVNFDTNFFIRDTKNLIVLWSEGINSRYFNTADASSIGVEGEIKATYNDNFFLAVNATYQKIQDDVLNERIANIPYLFGNLRTGYNIQNIFSNHDKMSLSLDSYFVNEFPFQSFSQGAPEERFFIPEQLSHNIQLGYSFKQGKYNISVQARNVTDAIVKDNLDIQKPGRAFYLKLRYFISN
ncbi:TonB-dependent receptor [Aquimarina sp. I32.4]|uniref:TonB-dependent receptor n=1 Tax=Aquimarina sp. I32.4 TaxID=2053903 RepID=UPI000CDEC9BD|nr:TonB-dependent receptor [Aquimarina sp. I32.4]